MRLQVFLSRNGVCSRRKAMDIIKEGRVTINEQVVTEPSALVNSPQDKIAVDGEIISQKNYEYILLNKPKGAVTTRKDPHAKVTVYDLLPAAFRLLVPVGRLDKETEGLLLLTNDGDVANKLTHPRYNILKTYFAVIKGKLEYETKEKLEQGIYVYGERTAPAQIRIIRKKKVSTELLITIHEGKKRQIRIMFSKCKHKVIYLKRISQGPLTLGDLGTGFWRKLRRDEIDKLRIL